MNAPNLPTKHEPVLQSGVDDDVRSCLVDMRNQIMRLLKTADMMHEGAVIPNWDTDCALPTMALNRSIYFLESLLGLDKEEKGAES